jgi:hypothetical protein
MSRSFQEIYHLQVRVYIVAQNALLDAVRKEVDTDTKLTPAEKSAVHAELDKVEPWWAGQMPPYYYRPEL